MRKYFVFCIALFCTAAVGQNARQDASAEKLYRAGLNALRGTPPSQNALQAFSDIRSAAELGYAPAQTALGYFFETGVATAREPGQAADWYKKSAASEDHLAQWLQGRLYLIGDGAQRNSNEAERWLRPAAEAGNRFAQYLLATSFEEKAPSDAAKWYAEAAAQDVAQAQYRLGLLLSAGRGSAVDKYRAYVMLSLALDNGISQAAPRVQQLEAELGTTQALQAKNEALDVGRKYRAARIQTQCFGWDGESDEIPKPPPPELHDLCR